VYVQVCFVADDVDDLMSLLDAGMHADHPGVIIDSDVMFGENMFGYSALRGRAAMRSRVGMFTVDWFEYAVCIISFRGLMLTQLRRIELLMEIHLSYG